MQKKRPPLVFSYSKEDEYNDIDHGRDDSLHAYMMFYTHLVANSWLWPTPFRFRDCLHDAYMLI